MANLCSNCANFCLQVEGLYSSLSSSSVASESSSELPNMKNEEIFVLHTGHCPLGSLLKQDWQVLACLHGKETLVAGLDMQTTQLSSLDNAEKMGSMRLTRLSLSLTKVARM